MDYNYNAYEILGLDTNATREEVEQRYKQLREKYQKDRFLPGEAGEDASENLQRIEVAYRDILASMEESTQTEDLRQEDDYTEIQQLIKENKLDEAGTTITVAETPSGTTFSQFCFTNATGFWKAKSNWNLPARWSLTIKGTVKVWKNSPKFLLPTPSVPISCAQRPVPWTTESTWEQETVLARVAHVPTVCFAPLAATAQVVWAVIDSE